LTSYDRLYRRAAGRVRFYADLTAFANERGIYAGGGLDNAGAAGLARTADAAARGFDRNRRIASYLAARSLRETGRLIGISG
jgi:hypothetical protein